MDGTGVSFLLLRALFTKFYGVLDEHTNIRLTGGTLIWLEAYLPTPNHSSSHRVLLGSGCGSVMDPTPRAIYSGTRGMFLPHSSFRPSGMLITHRSVFRVVVQGGCVAMNVHLSRVFVYIQGDRRYERSVEKVEVGNGLRYVFLTTSANSSFTSCRQVFILWLENAQKLLRPFSASEMSSPSRTARHNREHIEQCVSRVFSSISFMYIHVPASPVVTVSP